ncbi:MAG: asparagine synthase (glutamine-hydrolyzing), partial [Pseudomonadota bacterium]
MCGICGEIRLDGSGASASTVERMANAMAPRGPDGAGVVAQGYVAFGHRRLKIIDLSDASSQPFVDTHLGLTIAFNGCIYNYKELRAELEEAGYDFASTGDTEVILKAWHRWGADAVPRLFGMFAFALHNRETGETVFVRDRFGIKPLYLAQSGGALRFASTVQALMKAPDVDLSIDRIALHHYMTWHAVVPPPRTIYAGIRKLPPATIRVLSADGSFTDTTYWAPDFARSGEDAERPFEEWRDMVLESLRIAVRRRMVADVPVGVLLSGGVDSSVIVGLLAEEGQRDLATYSIGFEEAHGEKGDEFKYSDLIAEHYATNHHQIFIPSSEMFENL